MSLSLDRMWVPHIHKLNLKNIFVTWLCILVKWPNHSSKTQMQNMPMKFIHFCVLLLLHCKKIIIMANCYQLDGRGDTVTTIWFMRSNVYINQASFCHHKVWAGPFSHQTQVHTYKILWLARPLIKDILDYPTQYLAISCHLRKTSSISDEGGVHVWKSDLICP